MSQAGTKAGIARQSCVKVYTLFQIYKDNTAELPQIALIPGIIGIVQSMLHVYRLLGCVQMRDLSLGSASAQTSHDCRGLVCVWWRCWVSGLAGQLAPRPQSGSEEVAVVDIVGLCTCPVGSTAIKL
jgi:hypothetical protein